MREATYEKVHRINRNPSAWNDNELPEELYEECYRLAEYDAQSFNKEDQVEQKSLYINMFENVKSYNRPS